MLRGGEKDKEMLRGGGWGQRVTSIISICVLFKIVNTKGGPKSQNDLGGGGGGGGGGEEEREYPLKNPAFFSFVFSKMSGQVQ